MMNSIKVVLSTLLSFLLVATFSPFAFADEDALFENNFSSSDIPAVDVLSPLTDSVSELSVNSEIEWNVLEENIDYVSDEIVIIFKDFVTQNQMQSYLNSQDLLLKDIVAWYEPDVFQHAKIVTVGISNEMTLQDELTAIRQSDLVYSADLNGISEWSGMTLSQDDGIEDPNISNYVDFFTDVERANQWYLDAVNIENGWGLSRTAGRVSVAVLDTGIDFSHPDLKNNIDYNHAWDVVDNSPLQNDLDTHGTNVAGVVSAQANNVIGLAGVSYNANIIPIRIAYRDSQNKIRAKYASMTNAIFRLIEDPTIENLKVINISYTGKQVPTPALQAAIDNAYEHGVMVVCSAGNSWKNESTYPSDLNRVVSVISLNQNNTRSLFSSYGSKKDISAPGENIRTTYSREYGNGGAYGYTQGTSFSAPIVSGVLALMFAANPNLTPMQAEQALKLTATDLGPVGFDSSYGWGLVNTPAAIAAIANSEGKASITSAQVSGIENIAYTGNPVIPTPVVKLNGKLLRENTDYKVICSYNTEIRSIADMTIVGMGNYYGVVSRGFRVKVGWNRLWGDSALSTMKTIVREGFSSMDSDTAILATIDGYWDALTASGLAGLKGCPVILTTGSSLASQASDELMRLQVKKVYIVGGTSSVSNAVQSSVEALPRVEEVERIAGGNARETAVKIYEEGCTLNKQWGTTAIIATSNTFHDALAGSPFSYAKNAPVFLTNSAGTLDYFTVSKIKSGGFSKVLLLGGIGSVSDSVKIQLAGIECTRLWGASAPETSVAIANYSLQNGMVADNMAVATSESHYDALAGACFCGKKNSVLLLVSDANQTPIDLFVEPHFNDIFHGYIFGGRFSVSESVALNLDHATQ